MSDHFDYSRDFVQDWLDAADSQIGDAFFEFFCCFVTLNHLYFPFASAVHFDTRTSAYVENGERRGLEEFLKKFLPCLPRFEMPPCVKELFNPVQDVRSLRKGERRLTTNGENNAVGHADRRCSFGTEREIHDWLLIKTFLRIYQVRCNLFHGEKNHGSFRDVKLVEESAAVLRAFLEHFLRYGPIKYHFTASASSGLDDCLDEQ